MIVVSTLHGMHRTSCTAATRRTRTVACEGNHCQATAEFNVVAAYTELGGFSIGWAVKRKVTRLSSFDKNHTLWIASAPSTWWSRSKASCGLRMLRPTGCAGSICSYLTVFYPHATLPLAYYKQEIDPPLYSTKIVITRVST